MEKKMKRFARVASMACTIALSGLALQSCGQSDDVEETSVEILTRTADVKALQEVRFKQGLEELAQLQKSYVQQLQLGGMSLNGRGIPSRLSAARLQLQRGLIGFCQEFDLLSDLDKQEAEGLQMGSEAFEQMLQNHELFNQYVSLSKTDEFCTQLRLFTNLGVDGRLSVATIVGNEKLKWNERLLLTLAASTIAAPQSVNLDNGTDQQQKKTQAGNGHSEIARINYAVNLSWVIALAATGNERQAAATLTNAVLEFLSLGRVPFSTRQELASANNLNKW